MCVFSASAATLPLLRYYLKHKQSKQASAKPCGVPSPPATHSLTANPSDIASATQRYSLDVHLIALDPYLCVGIGSLTCRLLMPIPVTFSSELLGSFGIVIDLSKSSLLPSIVIGLQHFFWAFFSPLPTFCLKHHGSVLPEVTGVR